MPPLAALLPRLVPTLMALIAVTLVPAPAQAAVQYRVAFTSGGITPRTGPSLLYPPTGTPLADGALVAVVCEQRGTAVTNVYGETILIWERLSNGSWIPNAFVDTGTSSWTPGIARCSYNRSASASWAKANEQVQIAQVDPSNQCAAFASMVLWAGGNCHDVHVEPRRPRQL